METKYILLKSLFFIALFFISKFAYSQTVMTICNDSTIKIYSDYELKIHAERCKDGIKLLVDDSTQQILNEVHMKQCRMNGVYKRFYKNGVMMELGNYLEGKENGVFYFWNKNGILLRKETWSNGKRLKK